MTISITNVLVYFLASTEKPLVVFVCGKTEVNEATVLAEAKLLALAVIVFVKSVGEIVTRKNRVPSEAPAFLRLFFESSAFASCLHFTAGSGERCIHHLICLMLADANWGLKLLVSKINPL